jgi:hypothetical protein
MYMLSTAHSSKQHELRRRGSAAAGWSSHELAAHRLIARTATVAGAARRHELADGPDDLPLELAPLQRRPLLLGAVAAAADVLVVELHAPLPLFLLYASFRFLAL